MITPIEHAILNSSNPLERVALLGRYFCHDDPMVRRFPFLNLGPPGRT